MASQGFIYLTCLGATAGRGGPPSARRRSPSSGRCGSWLGRCRAVTCVCAFSGVVGVVGVVVCVRERVDSWPCVDCCRVGAGVWLRGCGGGRRRGHAAERVGVVRAVTLSSHLHQVEQDRVHEDGPAVRPVATVKRGERGGGKSGRLVRNLSVRRRTVGRAMSLSVFLPRPASPRIDPSTHSPRRRHEEGPASGDERDVLWQELHLLLHLPTFMGLGGDGGMM